MASVIPRECSAPSGAAKLHGEALRASVRAKLAAPSASMLASACASCLDVLPFEWDRPRGSGEVNAVGPSLTSALRYAYLKTTGTAPNPDTPDACADAIRGVLSDREKAAIFRDNLWRPPTSFFPLRGVPLQYILRHRFHDAVIRGIDVGAGINYLVAKLNSEKYLGTEFPGKNRLASVTGSVNVGLGLGIDKQPQDVLWLLASVPGSRQADVDRLRQWLAIDERRFPLMVADIAQRSAVDAIRARIDPAGDTPHVDFVVSSFCKYQLDDDERTQQAYAQFAPTFLRDGGIFVEYGDEVAPSRFSVSVYEKRAGEMRLAGSPFTIAMTGQIIGVDWTYFNV